ncbi:L-2-hydroxyglutarate dehydrogenase, mitochondrial [Lepeophtheirus salmonis]|uniref:L-2-hydroxyglutarate dehydrogenase, mitochondrial n=1 Tax=Lepeophtheirus salmonis TaxID=72036 RepID=UPI001AE98687|nr:L-2-hydroxyglutarate dehydrogenase, mitochondrial-like [Lepeophtheirus salmonis]
MRSLSILFKSRATTTHYRHQYIHKRHHSQFDVAIVGGGIVGCASAQELIYRHSHLKVALIEKESSLNVHQTGHNSGVIHAGLYYKPGSLMAKLCLEGLLSTYKFCDKYNIPYKKCGKLVVATSPLEVERLKAIYERATQNGVPGISYLSSLDEIQKIEPHCHGLEAISSPMTGVVDWCCVSNQYALNFQNKGGKIFLDSEIVSIDTNEREFISLQDGHGNIIQSKYVITCAGLYSDRVSVMTGGSLEPKIVPFRGEYFLLSPEKAKLIKGNIYPVPDPAFPFLGVHFTPRMNGDIWVGPNALPCAKREGYTWLDFSFKDLFEILRYPGFYKIALKYYNYGTGQIIGSFFPSTVVPELRKFIPSIETRDLMKGPSGVRAQAMNSSGDLVGDFIFSEEGDKRVLHCRNAPSPAATSSLAIARTMIDKVEERFEFPKIGNASLY